MNETPLPSQQSHQTVAECDNCHACHSTGWNTDFDKVGRRQVRLTHVVFHHDRVHIGKSRYWQTHGTRAHQCSRLRVTRGRKREGGREGEINWEKSVSLTQMTTIVYTRSVQVLTITKRRG